MAAPLLLDHDVIPDVADVLGCRYRIVRRLATSAMSEVFLARELAHDRDVAIKMLRPDGIDDIDVRGRFAREARTQAELTHPAIVPVLDHQPRAPLPYFVMPYIAGGSLASRAPAGVAAACTLLADVADALAFAHRHGVVHRDVKPSNILVDDAAGHGRLTDFGVAIVATSDHSRADVSRAMGTPGYMAPEQIVGAQDYDGRGDHYSLGVVAFELFAGRSPFGDGPAELVAARQLAFEAPPLAPLAPRLPRAVAAVIDRCLARDPRRRWPDGAMLADMLRRAAKATN